MPPPRRILILTNAELGAANVFLSILHSLVSLEPSLEIHIISFAALLPSVETAIGQAVRATPAATRPVFHPLPPHIPTLTEAVEAEFSWSDVLGRKVGWTTATAFARAVSRFFAPWDAPACIDMYRFIDGVVSDVRPDFALIDRLFAPGWSVCRERKVPFAHVMPNSLKDAAGPAQPRMEVLWKYPTFGAGLPFPVPWYHIPLNVFVALVLGITAAFDARSATVLDEVEKAIGVKVIGSKDFLVGQPPGVKLILACRKEIDFPMTVMPDEIIPCGPIVRPAVPVKEVDPELASWLERGSTVFINLGTLCKSTEAEAVEMAGAIRFLLDKAAGDIENLQVLWKLKKNSEYGVEAGSEIHSILGHELDHGSVRITSWVAPEPLAVLESGRIICSVNHGGAGSYNDAICSGTPQVVLPVWADTFDYAYRVEFLGVGRWGSPTACPKWKASELGSALVDVLLGPGADGMKKKAVELKDICAAYGEGRDLAAKAVLDLMKEAV